MMRTFDSRVSCRRAATSVSDCCFISWSSSSRRVWISTLRLVNWTADELWSMASFFPASSSLCSDCSWRSTVWYSEKALVRAFSTISRTMPFMCCCPFSISVLSETIAGQSGLKVLSRVS